MMSKILRTPCQVLEVIMLNCPNQPPSLLPNINFLDPECKDSQKLIAVISGLVSTKLIV